MGSILGWLIYRLSNKYAAQLRKNLMLAWANKSSADSQAILTTNIREMGKTICESPWIWRRPINEVLHKIQAVHGLEHLHAARTRGQGTIILTPHLGSFELIGLYVADQMPMTCMYRVPKIACLDDVIRNSRERGQMKLVRADLSGVRALFKALKRGETIGVLPDQVPGNGEGEWASFFGRPAYTMTLIGRLAQSSGATMLLTHCTRLPRGSGYTLHFSPLEFSSGGAVTQQLNMALENIIRTCPSQYLWSYNRYKTPQGVLPPDVIKES